MSLLKRVYGKLLRMAQDRPPLKQMREIKIAKHYMCFGLPLTSPFPFAIVKEKTLSYISERHINGKVGQYGYSESCPEASLYTSCYACITRDLYGDLTKLTATEKAEWLTYFDSFQSAKDGLFYDERLQNDFYETEDWWGARHLTAQLVTAYQCLGGKPRYPFYFLSFLYHDGAVKEWLDNLDWDDKIAYTSNTVMNIGVLLQYQRDIFGDQQAGQALCNIFAGLNQRFDAELGLWGQTDGDSLSKSWRSQLVQAAYHFLLLYFYDNRRLPAGAEKLVDQVLLTQNVWGGFGVKRNSSACEDIDSIDILYRFHAIMPYRRPEIIAALSKALPWVLTNWNADGGFVFERNNPLTYGHERMAAKANESHMFATWFRTVSLAYISQALQLPQQYHITRAPGYSFTTEEFTA